MKGKRMRAPKLTLNGSGQGAPSGTGQSQDVVKVDGGLQISQLQLDAFRAVVKYGSSTAAKEPFMQQFIRQNPMAVELMGLKSIEDKCGGLLRGANSLRDEGFNPDDFDLTEKGILSKHLIADEPSSVLLARQKDAIVARARASLSIYERLEAPDGRQLKKIRYGELKRMADSYKLWAKFCGLIEAIGQPTDHSIAVPEFTTAEQIESLFRQAEKGEMPSMIKLELSSADSAAQQ